MNFNVLSLWEKNNCSEKNRAKGVGAEFFGKTWSRSKIAAEAEKYAKALCALCPDRQLTYVTNEVPEPNSFFAMLGAKGAGICVNWPSIKTVNTDIQYLVGKTMVVQDIFWDYIAEAVASSFIPFLLSVLAAMPIRL